MTVPIAFHVSFRLVDSRVIAPTADQRRLVARSILERCSEARLLCFNVPDNHVHLEHAESKAVGAELVRRIKISISRQLQLPVGFAPPDHRPILHQGHLLRAFDYILRQQPRHGLAWDPYHEASNLSDLLGLRVIGAQTAGTVRQLLPRVDRRFLLRLLGVTELTETTGPHHRVLAAARAASGLTNLRRRSVQARSVWRAVLEVLKDELPLVRIAELLGVARETVHRIRGIAPDPRLVHAIRLQLGLRQAKQARPAGPFTDSAAVTGDRSDSVR